jgi:hypothetical protein
MTPERRLLPELFLKSDQLVTVTRTWKRRLQGRLKIASALFLPVAAGGRAGPAGSVDPRGSSRDGQCVPEGHAPHAGTVQAQESNPALFGVSEAVLEKRRQELQELDRARQAWRSGCRR